MPDLSKYSKNVDLEAEERKIRLNGEVSTTGSKIYVGGETEDDALQKKFVFNVTLANSLKDLVRSHNIRAYYGGSRPPSEEHAFTNEPYLTHSTIRRISFTDDGGVAPSVAPFTINEEVFTDGTIPLIMERGTAFTHSPSRNGFNNISNLPADYSDIHEDYADTYKDLHDEHTYNLENRQPDNPRNRNSDYRSSYLDVTTGRVNIRKNQNYEYVTGPNSLGAIKGDSPYRAIEQVNDGSALIDLEKFSYDNYKNEIATNKRSAFRTFEVSDRIQPCYDDNRYEDKYVEVTKTIVDAHINSDDTYTGQSEAKIASYVHTMHTDWTWTDDHQQINRLGCDDYVDFENYFGKEGLNLAFDLGDAGPGSSPQIVPGLGGNVLLPIIETTAHSVGKLLDWDLGLNFANYEDGPYYWWAQYNIVPTTSGDTENYNNFYNTFRSAMKALKFKTDIDLCYRAVYPSSTDDETPMTYYYQMSSSDEMDRCVKPVHYVKTIRDVEFKFDHDVISNPPEEYPYRTIYRAFFKPTNFEAIKVEKDGAVFDVKDLVYVIDIESLKNSYYQNASGINAQKVLRKALIPIDQWDVYDSNLDNYFESLDEYFGEYAEAFESNYLSGLNVIGEMKAPGENDEFIAGAGLRNMHATCKIKITEYRSPVDQLARDVYDHWKNGDRVILNFISSLGGKAGKYPAVTSKVGTCSNCGCEIPLDDGTGLALNPGGSALNAYSPFIEADNTLEANLTKVGYNFATVCPNCGKPIYDYRHSTGVRGVSSEKTFNNNTADLSDDSDSVEFLFDDLLNGGTITESEVYNDFMRGYTPPLDDGYGPTFYEAVINKNNEEKSHKRPEWTNKHTEAVINELIIDPEIATLKKNTTAKVGEVRIGRNINDFPIAHSTINLSNPGGFKLLCENGNDMKLSGSDYEGHSFRKVATGYTDSSYSTNVYRGKVATLFNNDELRSALLSDDKRVMFDYLFNTEGDYATDDDTGIGYFNDYDTFDEWIAAVKSHSYVSGYDGLGATDAVDEDYYELSNCAGNFTSIKHRIGQYTKASCHESRNKEGLSSYLPEYDRMVKNRSTAQGDYGFGYIRFRWPELDMDDPRLISSYYGVVRIEFRNKMAVNKGQSSNTDIAYSGLFMIYRHAVYGDVNEEGNYYNLSDEYIPGTIYTQETATYSSAVLGEGTFLYIDTVWSSPAAGSDLLTYLSKDDFASICKFAPKTGLYSNEVIMLAECGLPFGDYFNGAIRESDLKVNGMTPGNVHLPVYYIYDYAPVKTAEFNRVNDAPIDEDKDHLSELAAVNKWYVDTEDSHKWEMRDGKPTLCANTTTRLRLNFHHDIPPTDAGAWLTPSERGYLDFKKAPIPGDIRAHRATTATNNSDNGYRIKMSFDYWLTQDGKIEDTRVTGVFEPVLSDKALVDRGAGVMLDGSKFGVIASTASNGYVKSNVNQSFVDFRKFVNYDHTNRTSFSEPTIKEQRAALEQLATDLNIVEAFITGKAAVARFTNARDYIGPRDEATTAYYNVDTEEYTEVNATGTWGSVIGAKIWVDETKVSSDTTPGTKGLPVVIEYSVLATGIAATVPIGVKTYRRTYILPIYYNVRGKDEMQYYRKAVMALLAKAKNKSGNIAGVGGAITYNEIDAFSIVAGTSQLPMFSDAYTNGSIDESMDHSYGVPITYASAFKDFNAKKELKDSTVPVSTERDFAPVVSDSKWAEDTDFADTKITTQSVYDASGQKNE